MVWGHTEIPGGECHRHETGFGKETTRFGISVIFGIERRKITLDDAQATLEQNANYNFSTYYQYKALKWRKIKLIVHRDHILNDYKRKFYLPLKLFWSATWHETRLAYIIRNMRDVGLSPRWFQFFPVKKKTAVKRKNAFKHSHYNRLSLYACTKCNDLFHKSLIPVNLTKVTVETVRAFPCELLSVETIDELPSALVT